MIVSQHFAHNHGISVENCSKKCKNIAHICGAVALIRKDIIRDLVGDNAENVKDVIDQIENKIENLKIQDVLNIEDADFKSSKLSKVLHYMANSGIKINDIKDGVTEAKLQALKLLSTNVGRDTYKLVYKENGVNDFNDSAPLKTYIEKFKAGGGNNIAKYLVQGVDVVFNDNIVGAKDLFGWYKVANANNVEVDCPMGASVFSKAIDVIKQADIQYSRILWEYEGSELAIDVDPYVLRPKPGADGVMEPPKLNKRLFRAVDADKGDRDLYQVFSPNIRDVSLMNGLNQLLIRIEDLSGLSRGTLSDANQEARTATEIKIIKQRTYTTVSDNQAALETALKDVIRVMDKYATLYHLAPEGEYDVSFEWDDSILTDTDLQTQERLMLLNAGIISKAEFREWYFGETKAQAKAGITSVTDEQVETAKALNAALPGPDVNPEMPDEPDRDEEAAQPPKAPEPPRPKNPTAPDIPQPAQPKKG